MTGFWRRKDAQRGSAPIDDVEKAAEASNTAFQRLVGLLDEAVEGGRDPLYKLTVASKGKGAD